MTTVYIKGIGKCKSKVAKALRKSELQEGDHYIEGVANMPQTLLYWKTSRISLKDFKKGIGADIVWKHRLKFYEDIENLVVKEELGKFTTEELDLINEYR
jgi:hypothetical protein